MYFSLEEVIEFLPFVFEEIKLLYKERQKEKASALIKNFVKWYAFFPKGDNNLKNLEISYIKDFLQNSLMEYLIFLVQNRDFIRVEEFFQNLIEYNIHFLDIIEYSITPLIVKKYKPEKKIRFTEKGYSIKFSQESYENIHKERVFLLEKLNETLLSLDEKIFQRIFYLLIKYFYDNPKVLEYLISILLSFYTKNVDSISKKEFLRKVLQNILLGLPKKNESYRLKQEIILELGRELIYNLWLEDFAYILKLIKNFSLYLDKDSYYNFIITWGIYIFYLLTEEDIFFPSDKKKTLIENISSLIINDGNSVATFPRELEDAIEHFWGILSDKSVSLEEVIEKFNT